MYSVCYRVKAITCSHWLQIVENSELIYYGGFIPPAVWLLAPGVTAEAFSIRYVQRTDYVLLIRLDLTGDRVGNTTL